VLTQQAYVLKFYMHLLFPMHPELREHFKEMLWDKARFVTHVTTSHESIALVLHRLLVREHPKLPTALEAFETALMDNVASVQWLDEKTRAEAVEPLVSSTLETLEKFETFYFKSISPLTSQKESQERSENEAGVKSRHRFYARTMLVEGSGVNELNDHSMLGRLCVIS